jgi:uncharacterized protein YjiS (DUF1127 family)
MRMPLRALTTQLTAVPAVDVLPASRRRHSRAWRVLAARYITPSTWTENYLTRRRLLSCQMLDSRFVKDVGLTSAQIATECGEPFWAAVGLSRER